MLESETTRALNDAERAWVAGRARVAPDLVGFLLGSRGGGSLTPAALDEAFRAWRQLPATPDVTPKDIVECLGCAFGQFLVKDQKADWLVITDSFGTDLAIRRKDSDLTTFPLAIVAKRLDSPPEELSFFEPIDQSFQLPPERIVKGGI